MIVFFLHFILAGTKSIKSKRTWRKCTRQYVTDDESSAAFTTTTTAAATDARPNGRATHAIDAEHTVDATDGPNARRYCTRQRVTGDESTTYNAK